MLTTIGYERAELKDFLATLKLCEIDILIDIRDRAQSRRPGFSKSALSSALADVGIGYIHYPELGDPKEGREAARRGDYGRFREIFAQVMNSNTAKQALNKLQGLAENQNVCLMCFERNELDCHRKIVADYLELALDKKAQHLGVRQGASTGLANRRMRHTDQSATASLQQVF